MIAGDRCCALRILRSDTGKPFAFEDSEPKPVAEAVRRMNLKHVVITAVSRDDLKDGGADRCAHTIAVIRGIDPSIFIEVLVPDFAHDWCIQTVHHARPDSFSHDMETVKRSRLSCDPPQVSDIAAGFAPGKGIMVPNGGIVTKSGVMLGLGEKETELFQTSTICARSAAKC